MVVDDEPDITTMIKKALASQGFLVDTFNSSDEALRSFKPGDYDMLITDIRMPVMNGFELYREIRKKDDKIRVALMTAFEIHEDHFRKLFKDMDVRCFFKKPISNDMLRARISEELGIKQTPFPNR
jgi:DNA-binding response OmpR family regulator